jgi:membrane associated rhomboid family serine protease
VVDQGQRRRLSVSFWLFRPGSLYGLLALSLDGLRHGFPLQPFTYMFLHGGFTHLLFNMFTL